MSMACCPLGIPGWAPGLVVESRRGMRSARLSVLDCAHLIAVYVLGRAQVFISGLSRHPSLSGELSSGVM